MALRVVVVTVFFGAALVADVDALSEISDIRNVAILVLIVGTYALTIFYALLLRRGADPFELGTTQMVTDLVTVGVIVDVTRGLDSPFLFLFILTTVNAAVVLGRRPALAAAGAATLLMTLVAVEDLGFFADDPAPGVVWRQALLRLTTNGAANFIVAILAGALVERLGEARTQLAEQQSSFAELKALNENILASLSSGLLTVDATNQIIFVNQAAERIIGLEASEMLSRKLAEILPPVAPLVRGAGQPNGTDEGRLEAEVTLPSGEDVFLGFSVSVLRNAEDADVGRIVIFQDLSDIKRMEKQVRRSERLAAVGTLSAAIAHEIRNPLASISGSVEMLAEDSDASDDDVMLRGIIHREVGRLDKLISDFLEYAGERPLHLERRSPLPIIRDVLELFSKSPVGQGLEVDFRHDEDDHLELSIDPRAFQQVLWNLLINAGEATRETSNPRIEMVVAREGEEVHISVADNGPGIDARQLTEVFQPFFTTKEGGTGLGLASIYRIVEDHGATIEVEGKSSLGGASFHLTFPAAC